MFLKYYYNVPQKTRQVNKIKYPALEINKKCVKETVLYNKK